jgi:hypothetical protein
MPEFSLMQHQTEGVKFLDSVDGIGALLWDPGVGKTGATLAWVDRLAAKHTEVRVLVVAPLTAVDTWVLQAPGFMDSVVKARMLNGTVVQMLAKIKASHDWAKVPTTPVMVNHTPPAGLVSGNKVTILGISAGAVSSFCDKRSKTVQMLRAIRTYAPHVIVMDESHIIKSADANISKAMYQIGQLAPHRIILTGTVNPLSPLDCYGQWRFLAPWTFSDDYGKPFTKKPLSMTRMQQASIRPWPWGRMKTRYTVPGGYKGKGIKDFINQDELRARVSERAHVVVKKDALDLPPTSDLDIHVMLNKREQTAYNEMRDDLAAQMADGSLLEAPNALAKIMKLRQITAGFVRDTDADITHVIGDSKRKAQVEVATTQLAGEQRLVVGGYFKTECALLVEMLRDLEPKTTVEVITGATKNRDRLAIRQRFGDVSGNPNRTILVAQVRTMSLSVNELVTAANSVNGSVSERRVDWQQFRDRLDRKGQTRPVTFWNCYVPGSIDEVMLDNHKERGSLEKVLLDHIRQAIR